MLKFIDLQSPYIYLLLKYTNIKNRFNELEKKEKKVTAILLIEDNTIDVNDVFKSYNSVFKGMLKTEILSIFSSYYGYNNLTMFSDTPYKDIPDFFKDEDLPEYERKLIIKLSSYRRRKFDGNINDLIELFSILNDEDSVKIYESCIKKQIKNKMNGYMYNLRDLYNKDINIENVIKNFRDKEMHDLANCVECVNNRSIHRILYQE